MRLTGRSSLRELRHEGRRSSSRQRRSSTQRLLLDAADHRHRQLAQRSGQRVQRAAVPRVPPRADRKPGARHGSTGSAPLPIWLRAVDRRSTAKPSPSAARQRRRRGARASASISALRPRQQAQRRQPLAPAGRDRDRAAASLRAPRAGILSTRSARFIGLRLIFCDQVLAADDEAGLRAAEQLVAGEGDEVGAVGDRLRDVGSCGRPKRARSTSVPLPRSCDQRHVVLARDGGELARRAPPLVKPSMR